MERVSTLVARLFPGSGAQLHMGGIPIADIADRYGTPLYVYDARVLDMKWDLLRATLPPEFAIAYSVKANPADAVIRHFAAKGANLEVASAGEIKRALAAGCEAGRILFAGPGKSEAELELALREGVGEIHVESPLEARRIAALAAGLGVRARVALRVNPATEVQGGAMRMGQPARSSGRGEPRRVWTSSSRSLPSLPRLHSSPGRRSATTRAGAQYRGGWRSQARGRRLGRPLHTLEFGGGSAFRIPRRARAGMDKLRKRFRGGGRGAMATEAPRPACCRGANSWARRACTDRITLRSQGKTSSSSMRMKHHLEA